PEDGGIGGDALLVGGVGLAAGVVGGVAGGLAGAKLAKGDDDGEKTQQVS
ncbi:MAG: hypothetical protein HOV79_11975, partial [Hamadaea sp.]|nr:hypothetical protein [Hamadaea sp.]